MELYRSISGAYSWRVVVVAEDDSEAALARAKQLAIELDAELAERYGQRPSH